MVGLSVLKRRMNAIVTENPLGLGKHQLAKMYVRLFRNNGDCVYSGNSKARLGCGWREMLTAVVIGASMDETQIQLVFGVLFLFRSTIAFTPRDISSVAFIPETPII